MIGETTFNTLDKENPLEDFNSIKLIMGESKEKIFYLQRPDIKYSDYIQFDINHEQDNTNNVVYDWYLNNSFQKSDHIEQSQGDRVISFLLPRQYKFPKNENKAIFIQCKQTKQSININVEGLLESNEVSEYTNYTVFFQLEWNYILQTDFQNKDFHENLEVSQFNVYLKFPNKAGINITIDVKWQYTHILLNEQFFDKYVNIIAEESKTNTTEYIINDFQVNVTDNPKTDLVFQFIKVLSKIASKINVVKFKLDKDYQQKRTTGLMDYLRWYFKSDESYRISTIDSPWVHGSALQINATAKLKLIKFLNDEEIDESVDDSLMTDKLTNFSDFEKKYQKFFELLTGESYFVWDNDVRLLFQSENIQVYNNLISRLLYGKFINVQLKDILNRNDIFLNSGAILEKEQSDRKTIYEIENAYVTSPTEIINVNDTFLKIGARYLEKTVVFDSKSDSRIVWIKGKNYDVNNILSFNEHVSLDMYYFLFSKPNETFSNDIADKLIKIKPNKELSTIYTAWSIEDVNKYSDNEEIIYMKKKVLRLKINWTSFYTYDKLTLSALDFENFSIPTNNKNIYNYSRIINILKKLNKNKLSIQRYINLSDDISNQMMKLDPSADPDDVHERFLPMRLFNEITLLNNHVVSGYLLNAKTVVKIGRVDEITMNSNKAVDIYPILYKVTNNKSENSKKAELVKKIFTFWPNANKRIIETKSLKKIFQNIITHDSKYIVNQKSNQIIKPGYNFNSQDYFKEYEIEFYINIEYIDETTNEPYDPSDNKFGSLIKKINTLHMTEELMHKNIVATLKNIQTISDNNNESVYNVVVSQLESLKRKKNRSSLSFKELILYKPIVALLSKIKNNLKRQTLVIWRDMINLNLSNILLHSIFKGNFTHQYEHVSKMMYNSFFTPNSQTFELYAVGMYDYKSDIVDRILYENDIFHQFDIDDLLIRSEEDAYFVLKVTSDRVINQNRPVFVITHTHTQTQN